MDSLSNIFNEIHPSSMVKASRLSLARNFAHVADSGKGIDHAELANCMVRLAEGDVRQGHPNTQAAMGGATSPFAETYLCKEIPHG